MNPYLIVADVSKAYDNVDLCQLDKLIRTKIDDTQVLSEWEGQLADMRELNINVNGNIIKRTKGIPQGSMLGPLLFNFYTSCILERLEETMEMLDLKLFIYADNWIIYLKEINIEEAMNVRDIINNALEEFKLTFTLDDCFIARVDQMKDYPTDKIENWSYEKIKEQLEKFNEGKRKKRVLGWYFTFQNNEMSMAGKETMFNFKSGYFKRWKDAITFWRVFIHSKFRYQYEGMTRLRLKNLAKLYLEWFLKESIRWMQEHMLCYTIERQFLKDLMEGKLDEKQKNYFERWRKMKIVEPDIELKHYLKRLQDVGNYLLDNELYAGIYHITKTVKYLNTDKESLKERFKECEKWKNVKQYLRMIQVLESMYMAIMRKEKLSVVIFEDLETYANSNFKPRYKRRQLKIS